MGTHASLSQNNRDYFSFAGATLAEYVRNKFKDRALSVMDNVVEALHQLTRDQYALARAIYVEAYIETRDSYSS